MKLSIRTQIFASHLFLVALLIGSLSYRHYQNELARYTQSLIDFHTASSAALMSTVSSALSGGNYANMQLPGFTNELTRYPQLLQLFVSGRTDYDKTPFEARYDQAAAQVWRVYFEPEYAATLERKIRMLESKKAQREVDQVKLDFLIGRARSALREQQEYVELERLYGERYGFLAAKNAPFVDYERALLLLRLETQNREGGSVTLIFDLKQLQIMRAQILRNILLESFWALLFSLILLGLLSRRMTAPIDTLAHYMNSPFSELEGSVVPHLQRKDEIGALARSFAGLIEQMRSYMLRLEQLSKNDPLTGLLNRRAFEEIFMHLLERPSSKMVALCYCDIDYFKRYNDTYGHNAGDAALQKVASAINDALHRKSDHAFRLGGEEFAVMLSVESREDARVIAERIRCEVEALKIGHREHPQGVVTLSIGVCVYDLAHEAMELKAMTHCADEALYRAKANGRNRVEMGD
jgi:diguanylate cyclase (GGDEF)-like protein